MGSTRASTYLITFITGLWSSFVITNIVPGLVRLSQFRSILASIIQGSVIGPVSYVVTASDLQPSVSSNSIDEYADESNLIIPAVNVGSCATEIANVEKWAAAINLSLNRSKLVEIVFVAPRSKRAVSIPPLRFLASSESNQ